MNGVARLLASTKLAMVLCLLLAIGGFAGSLLYQGNTAFGKQGPFNIFRSPLFLVPAALLVVNIVFCAGKRLASLPPGSARTWTFAGMHLGIVLLVAGMVLDGLFGFIGTKYYYRGVPESGYTDWRKNREGAFPFAVEVVETETKYHPMNLQIGVKDADGNKVGLYSVREGVAFTAGGSGIRVTPRKFDLETKRLLLDAEVDGRQVRGVSASGESPVSLKGHSIVPVAYTDPEPSEFIARVRFLPPVGGPKEAEIGINRPASFAGISFCLVGLENDRYGNPYAGLQMTREPGEPVFWGGALLFVLSLVARFRVRKPAVADRTAESDVMGGHAGEAVKSTVAGIAVALFLSVFPAGAAAFGNVIDGDRIWEGEVRVTEPVTVEKGATLRIRPGTTVLLSGEDRDGDGCRDGYLLVFGTLLVEGERNRPVRFARLHPGKAWEEIFLKSATADIRYAVFEGANWGLHIHDGKAAVEQSVFRGNGGGAKLRGKGADFSRCTFRGNGVGLRFWDGGPRVRGSDILENGTGFFYREGTGGGDIRGNRIEKNEWNLKVGDWAAGELDASGNYWGSGGDSGSFGVGDFREMKEAGRIALLPALAAPPEPCGADLPKADGPAMTYVEADTAWSGEVRVEGIVHVRKNATLTILPGTRVVFAGSNFQGSDGHEGFSAPGIKVEGRIVAEGTEDAPILFTSAGQPAKPGGWDKILFSFSTGNRFRYCTFEGGRYAFHAHFSEISVSRCIFRENEEGVRLGVSRVQIEDSVFTRNEIRGINFRECRNVIRRNLVFGNGDGIYLHSKNSASTIRENAVYANRGYNVRLGDLHSDDIDLSGNWWGTTRETEAREKIHDGRNLPGIGAARLSPLLDRPPVAGAEIRGVLVFGRTPVPGGVVRAYPSLSEGFSGEGVAAEAVTDEYGAFRLSVPPGRYFVVGRAQSPAGALFAFPGKNPVLAVLGETSVIGLPAVVAPPVAEARTGPAQRSRIVVRTTLDGKPAPGVSVQAHRTTSPDLRGPGEASAVTDDDGIATLHLPPGKYLLSARKRTTRASLGMVDEGGLFGFYPHSPLDLPGGSALSVEIPLFEKKGLLSGEEPAPKGGTASASLDGRATLDGKPAPGYLVFFYRPPDTIGRPVARSSPISGSGAFSVSLPGPGEYASYLRKSIPGLPGGAEEERIGPVRVRVEGGRFIPPVLSFR